MGAAVVTFDRVENPDFDFVDVSTSRALALVASSSIEDSVGDGTISTDMVDLEDRTDDELRDKALLKDERRAASPMLLLLTELILMELPPRRPDVDDESPLRTGVGLMVLPAPIPAEEFLNRKNLLLFVPSLDVTIVLLDTIRELGNRKRFVRVVTVLEATISTDASMEPVFAIEGAISSFEGKGGRFF